MAYRQANIFGAEETIGTEPKAKPINTKQYIITVEEGIEIDPRLYDNVIQAESVGHCKDCIFFNSSADKPLYIYGKKQFGRGAIGCYRAAWACFGEYDIDVDMDDPEGYCSNFTPKEVDDGV